MPARSMGPVMDDDTFKKELLSRLDQIIELLTFALPEASLEEPEPAAVITAPLYLIGDELQEDYQSALQKWKQQKPAG